MIFDCGVSFAQDSKKLRLPATTVPEPPKLPASAAPPGTVSVSAAPLAERRRPQSLKDFVGFMADGGRFHNNVMKNTTATPFFWGIQNTSSKSILVEIETIKCKKYFKQIIWYVFLSNRCIVSVGVI